MALPPRTESYLAKNCYTWCGHSLAPDFQLVRLPPPRHALEDLPRTPDTRSCDECSSIARTGRCCTECDRWLCEGCMTFSFTGFVASDAFLCYRCHPSDVSRGNVVETKMRRCPSTGASTPTPGERSRRSRSSTARFTISGTRGQNYAS